MSVLRRKNGYWFVDFVYAHPNGQKERVRRKSAVQTRRGAEEYERQLRASLLDGTYGKKEEVQVTIVPMFKNFAQEFLQNYARVNNKPSEVASKEMILRVHLPDFFGEQLLNEIHGREIEKYKALKLHCGLSKKSINNHLAVLKRLLNMAKKWGYLATVPESDFLRVSEQTFDFLTAEESQRLINAADGQWRHMIVVALKTGLRIGELRALQWSDVDLVARKILVRHNLWRTTMGSPKNGKPREVPLCDTVLVALRMQRHIRGPFVFCNEDGSFVSPGKCEKPLKRAYKKAGLREISWHMLRHSFASHLVIVGASLKVVQELMGHADIKMTLRYAHLSPEVSCHAVKLLDHGTPMALEVSVEHNLDKKVINYN